MFIELSITPIVMANGEAYECIPVQTQLSHIQQELIYERNEREEGKDEGEMMREREHSTIV
jgi:hypothetical protein